MLSTYFDTIEKMVYFALLNTTHMKVILITLFSVLSVGLFAQAPKAKPVTPAASSDCWKEWYTLFKERGATPVADGTHEVIITIRNKDYSECFLGKIDVAGGKLASKLQVQKVDGSYEEFDRTVSEAYQNATGTLKDDLRNVVNGMSASATLTDGETIRLFFYKSLAEKPKANKKAPAPASLINK